MSAAERLAELGIQLPDVAVPVGAYVPAARVGSQVWTSGQLPFIDGRLPLTGKVGAEVTQEAATDAARTAALNALAAASARSGRFEVWVSHMFVQADLAQDSTRSGEALILRQRGGAAPQVLARWALPD